MVNLKRCELDFDKTFDYFFKDLNETNTLSTELTNLVDWKAGNFFTFLPINVKAEHIHAFDYYRITTNKNKIEGFIFNEMKNNQLYCVFDYFSGEFKPGYNQPLFQVCGLHYQKEIYFFMHYKNASPDLIEQCFFFSDVLWHSLCVLSKIDLSNKLGKELTLSEIENICLNASLVVVGAYDAEGYVMWESNEKKHSSVTKLNDDERQD